MTPPTVATAPRQGRHITTLPSRAAGDHNLSPLPDEADLWAATPLHDGRRDLRDWPDATRARLVTHYLPFTLLRLRRHAVTLAYDLPDDEVGSQAAEWLLKALSRYDPSRGPTFAAYLATMLSKWVYDVARDSAGRYVTDSKAAILRTRDRCLTEHQHEPTEAELTDALGGDPDTANSRRRAVVLADGLRRARPLDSIDVGTLAVHTDGGLWTYGNGEDLGQPEDELLARDAQRSATWALAQSAWHGDGLDHGDNTFGLLAFALIELDGHTKQDVAAAIGCHTRRITRAINALRLGTVARLSGD